MTNREWNTIKAVYGIAPEIMQLTMRDERGEVKGVINIDTDFDSALGLIHAAARDAVRKFVEFGDSLEEDGFFKRG